MRTIDLISLFAKRYPQARFSPKFLGFVEEQERLGHPIVRAHTRQPLADFLRELGVDIRPYARFLTPESKLVLTESYPRLLKRDVGALDAFVARRFAPVFALQQVILDSERLTGFNRHGKEHVRAVTHKILRLMQYSDGKPERTPARAGEAVVAGYLHDVGNLLTRKEHGYYGLYLLTRLLTDVDRDRATLESFLRVMEAVLFHEVEYGSQVASLGDLSPLTLCLIVADKTDVSLHRVSSKSNDPKAIRDAHMLVNLLVGDSHLKLGKERMEWLIHFTPKISPGQAPRFPALLKRADRVWVPAVWQSLYRRENIEYVFVFQATFLRVYFTRLLFAMRAIFALSPALRTFRLVIQDDERGVSLSRAFSRDDYQGKAELIAKNLFKNARRP